MSGIESLLGGNVLASPHIFSERNALLEALQPSLRNPYVTMWVAVEERFRRLDDNLKLTSKQIADGNSNVAAAVRVLNKAYYGQDSETENFILAGSWAKGTPIRPPADVDIFYLLP